MLPSQVKSIYSWFYVSDRGALMFDQLPWFAVSERLEREKEAMAAEREAFKIQIQAQQVCGWLQTVRGWAVGDKGWGGGADGKPHPMQRTCMIVPGGG